ncbi:uncharacterized protein LOC130687733 [Daphnia carinata]|uniref:uncharacterized protein LOC130687733 n=1 Tax=Daphnia carinata TaxID=120202 RepID=UPI002579D2B6|nr:uncharacterized protein LOC130687733 [Daphnia carinata]
MTCQHTMCSSGSLKIINYESYRVLQEVIADIENVSFATSSCDSDLWFVGYSGSKLHILPALDPQKAQIISFEDNTISSTYFSSEGIFVTLGNDRIAIISQMEHHWKKKAQHDFDLRERKIIACFTVETGLIIFIQHSNLLIIGFSENPPEWQQVASIDCFDTPNTVYICQSSKAAPDCYLIGTQDGHVYQLQLKQRNLTFLCDIQQPIISIQNVDDKTALVVGKYGKIARLTGPTKEALISFSPTAVESCFYSGHQLYLVGSNQLYSMEIKLASDGRFLEEAIYCKVKFVRAVHLRGETIFILTENGTIYQCGLLFGSNEEKPSRQRNGAELKEILQEIHSCADRAKTLGTIRDSVLLDVAQLSIALNMVNQDISDRFPVIVHSFSEPKCPRNQRLIFSVTNKSAWNLSSRYWIFQISVHRVNESSLFFRDEWKTGDTLELDHQLVLLEDMLEVAVKISLIFRLVDPNKMNEPPSIAVFPLSTIKLCALDFLEPALSDVFDVKNSHSDVIGFSRTQIKGCPWPILLQRSWHRGFAQRIGDPTPVQMVLRCGTHLLRMNLKEDENHTDKIWILRIETSNFKLLRFLRNQIFQLIEGRYPLVKPDFVKIPSHVLANLQNLRGRVNYLQNLGNWDESDTEPLMEEFRLLMAKQLSLR